MSKENNESPFTLLKYDSVEEAICSVTDDNIMMVTALNKVLLRKIIPNAEMMKTKSGLKLVKPITGCGIGVIEDVAPNSRLWVDGFRKGMVVLFHEGSAQEVRLPRVEHTIWLVPDLDVFAVLGFNREELNAFYQGRLEPAPK
jgi:hypothetical protein